MNASHKIIEKFSDFLIKSLDKYDSKYDYQFVDYVNCKTKIDIVCNRCVSKFTTTPLLHLNTTRGECPICGPGKKYNYLTTNKLIKILKANCGDYDYYDYSDIVYQNINIPVIIGCKICGYKFSASPKNLLKNPKCRVCYRGKKLLSDQVYINRAIKIHGSTRYNYSNINYHGLRRDITITCNKCSITFNINAQKHLNGKGCRC
ncbi:hypothetical protein QLL95_gp0231 [Cotonvirus japonicus]|uniref:Uncharacterized protein n=1 Tax=Cotonvirus japonicus TaxID=2811091 RepID=A0ABM7NRD9_9VIRU|nr:hypothetical protein QLL95_gp0231 [Cotonvirus japonicus]BCS82720.1 hypothetical protein [Cotonvirus japonicus]